MRIISKYRNVLFGLSILSIMLFHFCENAVSTYSKGMLAYGIAFLMIRLMGSIGVEVFLFLSGVGLYYSYSVFKGKITDWYRKRFMRILSVYIPVGGVLWFIRDIVLRKSIVKFLEDYSLVSFWKEGNRAVWFIALILVLYIIFPLYYKMVFSDSDPAVRSFLGLLAVVVGISIVFSLFAPEYYSKVEIAISRVPIFLIGGFCGYYIKKNYKLNERVTLIATIIVYVVCIAVKTFSFPSICVRYATSVLGIFLCVFIPVILQHIGNGEYEYPWLSRVGGLSLELYISHVMIRSCFRDFGFDPGRPEIYLVVVVLAFIVSFLTSRMNAVFKNRRFIRG